MAITETEKGSDVWGTKRVKFGTFTTATAAGGTISTGLRRVEYAEVNVTGGTNTASVRNVSFPTSTGDLDIRTSASSTTGTWLAIGY